MPDYGAEVAVQAGGEAAEGDLQVSCQVLQNFCYVDHLSLFSSGSAGSVYGRGALQDPISCRALLWYYKA